MRHLMSFAARRPFWVLGALALLTALAAMRLGELQLDLSVESMTVRNDPSWGDYQRALATFGSDNLTIVYLGDPDLFAPPRLATIRAAVERLDALPFVEGTESLFSATNVKSVDGYITTRPFLDPLPLDPEATRGVMEDARRNPLVAHNLVSADARAMAINVYLRPNGQVPGDDARVAEAIDGAIAPLRGQLAEVFQIGPPYIRASIMREVLADQRRLLPLALGVTLVVLGLSLRRVNGAVMPFFTAAISILWTLGLMAAAGVPLTVLTSIVPALLIIVGSTEDVHLLAEYHAGIQRGLGRREAIGEMSRRMGLAILITATTTCVGFLSIALNDMEMLRQFGVIASVGLALNFLVTALFTPAALRLVGARRPKRRAGRGGGLYGRLAVGLFHFVERRKRATLVVFGAISVAALYGATSIRVNNNPIDYFGPDSSLRQRADTLQAHLAGMQTFSIVLESGIDGTFQKVKYLEQIARLEQEVARLAPGSQALSFADYLGLVHTVMEEDGLGPHLPASDDIVREYLLFLRHDLVRSYVSADYARARILVRHDIESSHAFNAILGQLQGFVAREIDPALRVHVTGESVLSARAATSIARGQGWSLGVVVLVILGVVGLLFVNLKAGLVAVLPNLFPVAVLFGVMGLFGIPLDSGTAMVAAVALGLGVDDTMHFMARYHFQSRSVAEPRLALARTVREEATPIIATSVALGLGFGTLAVSTFQPVVHFGLLSALVMLVALLSTLVLTPILLATVRLITLWDMLALRLGREVLERCDLFRGLRPWQIKQVILSAEVRACASGETIIRQYEPGQQLFVVIAGSVAVHHMRADGSVVRLDTLGTGALFGEIALASRMLRTATVVAEEPCQVLALEWEDIRNLSRYYPRTAGRLFLNMTSVVTERLAAEAEELRLKDESTGLYVRSFLTHQAELEIARARRYGQPLSLLVLHAELRSQGRVSRHIDAHAVRAVTEAVWSQIRVTDVLARCSTHRFAMLLPRTALEQARAIATRFRAGIEDQDLCNVGRLRVSVGLAEYRDGDDSETLLKRADAAVEEAIAEDRHLVALRA